MTQRMPSLSRWLRFSLRSMLILVLLSSVGFAKVFYEYRKSEQRRDAVRQLTEFPGFVLYETKQRASARDPVTEEEADAGPLRKWLVAQLGVDFFHDVEMVCLDGRRELTDEQFASACCLHGMKSLRLGKTAVTDAGFEAITRLTELEKFSISSPHLSDRAMDQLSQLKQLKQLSLFEINITDKGLVRLSELSQLEDVYLRKTGVTEDGVASLQAALPDCNITLKDE